MVLVPTHRLPSHRGEMVLEDFLVRMGITQRELADAISVPFPRGNVMVMGRGGVTPSTALRLSQFFGTSSDFWMNLQLRWDLYHAQRAEADVLKKIRRFRISRRKRTPA